MSDFVKHLGSALIGLTIVVIPYLTCYAISHEWHPLFKAVLLIACVLEWFFVAALACERSEE